jgi:hypothetical protein
MTLFRPKLSFEKRAVQNQCGATKTAASAAAAQFCDVLPTKVEAAVELRTGGALVFVPLFVIPFSFC